MINLLRVQQNILYVCPTLNSGTRERMILRDCLLLKEIGHNVFIYCIEGSFLDLSCKENGINPLYHEGKEFVRLIKWYKLRKLKSYINRLDINIVHCYELNYIWPLAYFLKNKNLTPLFFTLSHDIEKFYNQFWFRPLLARLDLVFLPVKEMAESIHGHLDIPLRKIYFSGFGLKKVEFQKVKKKLDENVWNLACWINDTETNFDELAVCFETLWSINTKGSLGKVCHLHIHSNGNLEKSKVYKSIKKLIKKYRLEQSVHVKNNCDINDINADIWISYNSITPLEDYSLVAMLKGIPALTPRNATTQELRRIHGKINETYKIKDAREMRSMLELMINDYSKYLVSCEISASELWLEHGQEGYKYNLYKIYEKHLNKRRRFYS